jgi:rod shape determining protein RodA
MLISSATSNSPILNGLWEKQLIVLAAGVVAMLITGMINYRILLKLSMPIYIGTILLLLAVVIMGKVAGGARSWITIAGIGFQPSEFAKLSIILALASHFAGIEHSGLMFKDLIKPGFLLAIPLVLIAAQPDLGTAITMVPLFFGIALVAGMRFRVFIALILIGLILLSAAWMFLLKDYQKERLHSFLNPDDDPRKSGYQIKQSLIAIGSGGLFGKGLFLGSQSQLNFVPAQHTDFIFSVLGEELGFISVLVVLTLFGILFVRALFPLRHVHNIAGIYLVVGVVSYLSFQTVINVLMSIGLFPTTGVPLPFLSYGGSSLLTNFIGIGLIISVYAHRGQSTPV